MFFIDAKGTFTQKKYISNLYVPYTLIIKIFKKYIPDI